MFDLVTIAYVSFIMIEKLEETFGTIFITVIENKHMLQRRALLTIKLADGWFI
jgi:hypothetical protein